MSTESHISHSSYTSQVVSSQLAASIKAKARELGFDLVGITSAEPSAFADAFRDWIARGLHGEMAYMAKNPERRVDPSLILPDARSIIAVGMNYYAELKAEGLDSKAEQTYRSDRSDQSVEINKRSGQNQESKTEDAAVFARYARGDDYHDVMTPRLRDLLAYIKEIAGDGVEGRVYVDTGPVLEREVARRAGLGWFGKNTMLINTRRGSYFFLGEIIINVDLPQDEPAVGGCGTCTKCIDACPTGAITGPYELDARRCISYLTIELKGQIPEEFRPAIAATNRIYGCDICQEVCPFNRPADTSANPTLVSSTEPAFQPRAATTGRTLFDLSEMSEVEFREQYKGSAVKRTKWSGLVRNVAAALSPRLDDQTITTHEPIDHDQAPEV